MTEFLEEFDSLINLIFQKERYKAMPNFELIKNQAGKVNRLRPSNCPSSTQATGSKGDEVVVEGGLWPCGYCEGNDLGVYEKHLQLANGSLFWAECNDCGARGPLGDCVAQAKFNWNKRPKI